MIHWSRRRGQGLQYNKTTKPHNNDSNYHGDYDDYSDCTSNSVHLKCTKKCKESFTLDT